MMDGMDFSHYGFLSFSHQLNFSKKSKRVCSLVLDKWYFVVWCLTSSVIIDYFLAKSSTAQSVNWAGFVWYGDFRCLWNHSYLQMRRKLQNLLITIFIYIEKRYEKILSYRLWALVVWCNCYICTIIIVSTAVCSENNTTS